MVHKSEQSPFTFHELLQRTSFDTKKMYILLMWQTKREQNNLKCNAQGNIHCALNIKLQKLLTEEGHNRENVQEIFQYFFLLLTTLIFKENV